MASSFRIPKKKVPSDSAPLHRDSPLSRLQGPAPRPQSYQGYRSRCGPGARVPSEGPGGSPVGLPRPSFRDTLKTVLGLDEAAAANHTAAAASSASGGAAAGSGETTGKTGDLEDRSVLKSNDVMYLRGERDPGTWSSFKSPLAIKAEPGSSLAMARPSSSRKPLGMRAMFACKVIRGEKQSLKRTSSSSGGGGVLSDVGEQQPVQSTSTEKKSRPNSTKVKAASSEPIVLSSEDEEPKTSSTNNMSVVAVRRKLLVSSTFPLAAPSSLHLDFLMLHAGQIDANANGQLKIMAHGISIPLKGTDDSEEAEVTVVASQLRGYGLWDGGMATGGTLLADWEGPAPSLLFLWVTDAQANLLQRELFDVCWAAATSPPCAFLLLVLKEQLPELQVALLASIFDMKEYQQGRACLSSPLSWADGLLLLQTCPAPLDHRFLKLLGETKSSQLRISQKKRQALQQLPTRLIQYPRYPCKGRITVTEEDLACLNKGQLLNDVIIDFYLKYLLLEGVGGAITRRTHVFSSFFFKQLSRRRVGTEGSDASVPDSYVRHERVKTWTRHVDIFDKDFLIIPVNQDSHWFLVVVCYPGLQESYYEDFQCQARPSDQGYVKTRSSVAASPPPPQCTLRGWTRGKVFKRPCILLLNSLRLSYHGNVCRQLREYLQVEWSVRRSTPRSFDEETMKSCNCKVPQQDNSIDCGVYLLQYAHSFLQNPVVHFDLPLQLDGWFPRQQVQQKREEIRRLILQLRDEAP